MPDREKVFDAIRNCITEPKCKDCPWEDCERFSCKKTTVPVTLMLDALELLREKETTYEDCGAYICGDEIFEWWKCKKCGDNVYVKSKCKPGFRYCSHCGRTVKWE